METRVYKCLKYITSIDYMKIHHIGMSSEEAEQRIVSSETLI